MLCVTNWGAVLEVNKITTIKTLPDGIYQYKFDICDPESIDAGYSMNDGDIKIVARLKERKLKYVEPEEFESNVNEYAKTNFVLRSLLNNKKYTSWQQLPTHLMQDLFRRLGCKPKILKF